LRAPSSGGQPLLRRASLPFLPALRRAATSAWSLKGSLPNVVPKSNLIYHLYMVPQAHPFSLSYVPKNDELRITVKQLGDFTKQLSEVPVGTKVLVDGPYGVFTDLFAVSEKVLLIAGGIGITPIRAMMEVMLLKHKQVVLLYANRTESDIALRKEVDELAQKYGANVVHILSGDEKFAGERGFVDEEKVKRLVPDFLNRDVYVCGPPPMMNGLIDLFEKLGLPSHQLHYEKFSLH
jgi:predicted ferric reductase